MIGSAIIIEGQGSTIQRKSNAPPFRLFSLFSLANLTLKDVTLTGGEALPGEDGSAIYNSAGTLTLINVTVSGNTGPRAVYSIGNLGDEDDSITITNSTFADNVADPQYSAEALLIVSQPFTVTDSRFVRNTGTGLAITDSSGSIESSVFRGNLKGGLIWTPRTPSPFLTASSLATAACKALA